MSDPRNILQDLFKDAHRYTNFGDVIISMHVKGFRCHTNTLCEVNSPITAFCGLNGTGKSTLLQLASAAYKRPVAGIPQYNIDRFFRIGTLDPNPFTLDANVEYKILKSDGTLRPQKYSRNNRTKRWQGYARRSDKYVLFAGAGVYLPKLEHLDFISRNASRLSVSSSSAVAAHIKAWTCKILGHNYDNIYSNTVMHFRRSGQVLSVERTGLKYSEHHMGFGEARSQYLISMLETAPDKSLILIEEPEISLHPSAQYQFGCYLVDVSIRKRHQIMLTTHSDFLLSALHSSSRIYLKKNATGIDMIPGLTSSQAKSLMADGHVKALHVLVEDDCAKGILSEMLLRLDRDFLKSVGIHAVGSAETIGKSIRAIKNTGLPVAAVRDPEFGAQPAENLFKLPGTQAPEKEMFNNSAVKAHILSTYGISIDDFATTLAGVDHHEWFNRLAQNIGQDEAALTREVARIYANNLPEAEVSTLITLLKESVRR